MVGFSQSVPLPEGLLLHFEQEFAQAVWCTGSCVVGSGEEGRVCQLCRLWLHHSHSQSHLGAFPSPTGVSLFLQHVTRLLLLSLS